MATQWCRTSTEVTPKEGKAQVFVINLLYLNGVSEQICLYFDCFLGVFVLFCVFVFPAV